MPSVDVEGLFFGTTFDLPTALMEGRFGDDHSKDVQSSVSPRTKPEDDFIVSVLRLAG